MSRLRSALVLVTTVALAGAAAHAGGYAAHVVSLDPQAHCLAVEWDNDTERKVCWTEKTTFSDQDTGKSRKAADLRVGSFLRMQGEQKGDTYWASEIVIWESVSRPPSAW